ncbi:hydroxymethylbilane synthase [Ornithinimicrobium pratense]|uniref:Porphobilinogen deaminase n=1 Tax=Ornithinimicrobium pratense TaxID=2593973 RepID=A0A5J6V1I4_9MICO|nr:hydroxymethylbilane synthase [Ornithinimicrobium pratense]QFG67650.1 hydroxymethylbilane synthase [Ornithinimicrobium pratense]
MTGRPLRLGTRASALATSQSDWVAERLRAAGYQVELVHVRTEGDVSRASLQEIGGTGVFASALRDALRRGEVDLAVHSLKDLPTAPEAGLTIAAVPEREDPRDVLVARDGLTLAELPTGAVIGTGSPRRAAQLALARPDVQVRDIRGNVGTRIDLVRHGELDAVVLARAGLARLDRLADATDTLELDVMLPAPGQAALAVECREADHELVALLERTLEHAPTRAAVTAERAVLAALEAGCTAPIAALATPVSAAPHPSDAADGALSLHVFVALQDLTQRHEATGTDPVALGHEVAQQLLTEQLMTRPDPAGLEADRSRPAAVRGAFEPEPDL